MPDFKILAIDDDPEIRRFLRVFLTEESYEFLEAKTGRDGVNQAASQNPDLIILDLGLPDGDGVGSLKAIREWSQVPVIILSSRDEEAQKVRALDCGANDFLSKPFGVQELNARIRVALRPVQSAHHFTYARFEFGNVLVDMSLRQVLVDNVKVKLSPTEYKLLLLLIQNADKIVTQDQIMRHVWGAGFLKDRHYLRIYMASLRKKLERDPSRPRYLLTEPGVGCRLRTDLASI